MKKLKISRNKLLFLWTALLLLHQSGQAQEKASYLEPDEAVRIALEKNLGVEVSRQNQEISKHNYSWGNAGFLPIVTARAAKNWRVENTEQVNSRNETTKKFGAMSNALSYGIAANWILFDGLGMFSTYKRLGLEYEASRLFNQQAVNEIAASVLSTYYQLTLQQQRLDLWQTTLEVSEQRLRLAKDRYEVGKTSKQDYLAALVDYNADKAALLAQQEALQNTRHLLNRLLGQAPTVPINTIDTLQADSVLVRELLLPQPIVQNPAFRAAELDFAASEQFIEEQRARYWPTVSLDLGYNFIRQNAEVGFALYNQAAGFAYGVSASWLLFDGFNARRNVQVARIQARIADLNRQQLELDLLTTQADALVAYRNQWQQIDLERDNLEYARESVLIALDRYRLGVITPLELRAAQQSAQQAALRLLSAVYELKLAEVELMRVSGQLMEGL